MKIEYTESLLNTFFIFKMAIKKCGKKKRVQQLNSGTKIALLWSQ